MNFLAHSILSPKSPLVMLGNLCGDLIKGNKFEGINLNIIEGVRLHRSIDSFTDSHQLIREAKSIVRPEFKLFSGIDPRVVHAQHGWWFPEDNTTADHGIWDSNANTLTSIEDSKITPSF